MLAIRATEHGAHVEFHLFRMGFRGTILRNPLLADRSEQLADISVAMTTVECCHVHVADTIVATTGDKHQQGSTARDTTHGRSYSAREAVISLTAVRA